MQNDAVIMDIRYQVVLASASPRRKELLAKLIADFEIVPSGVDESGQTDPGALARQKAEDVAKAHPGALVIGSDTVVFCQGTPLGKPSDDNDAMRMLSTLSGKTHTVVTGVCLVWPGGESNFTDSTRVRFRELTEAEINEYVSTGEPSDKAGAYAIQGGASKFVEEIDGDYDNVVGLPVQRLGEVIKALELCE